MKKTDVRKQVSEAISACQEKKADEITVLELEKNSGAFTDYFVVCSGTNPRQIQAISDETRPTLRPPTTTTDMRLSLSRVCSRSAEGFA